MRKKGVFFLLMAGTLWGFMGFFVRNMMALGLDQVQVIFIKMLFGTVFLASFFLIKDPSLFRVEWKHLWFFVASGLISQLGFNFFYYKAMEVTTLALAGVLLYVAPGITMLLSAALFREKITIRKVVSLFVIFGGCACAGGVFGGELYLTFLGFFLCFIAAFCYALYSIFGRIAVNKGYRSYTITFYTMLFCLVGSLPLVNYGGIVEAMWPMLILFGFGLGVPCAAIACVFYNCGLQYVDAGEAAMLATMEPVVAALVSVFIFGEPMTGWILLGIVLIIGGICIMNYVPKRKNTHLT